MSFLEPEQPAIQRWVHGLAAAILMAALVALANGCGSGGGDEQALPAEAQRGRELADSLGCAQCHSADGSRRSGPTWQGIWGEQTVLDDGTTAMVDEEYVATAISDPSKQVADGFNAAMPAFDLTDEETAALIAYIRALGNQ